MNAELIARLEGADTGTFALDAEVARAFDWPDDAGVPPPFTVSVDRALALVPKDWFIASLGHRFADITIRKKRVCVASFELNDAPYTAVGRANTIPLAICIAVLRDKDYQDERGMS